MIALVIGDTHIPDRAERVPRALEESIRGYRFDYVFFTGDLTSKTVEEWLRPLGEHLYIVRGNMDYLPYRTSYVVELGEIKVGLIHGDQVHPRGDIRKLTHIAKRLGADLLISGHTHYPVVALSDSSDVLHLNPGSATGVWGGGGGSMRPSLMIMYIHSAGISVDLIELDPLRRELSRREYVAEKTGGKWLLKRQDNYIPPGQY